MLELADLPADEAFAREVEQPPPGFYKLSPEERFDKIAEASDSSAEDLEVPMPVGLIGGATKTHPTARAAVRLLGVESASELAQVIVAVGLAQNLGALRALATEGIQRGHMTLHARDVAIAAGARTATRSTPSCRRWSRRAKSARTVPRRCSALGGWL